MMTDGITCPACHGKGWANILTIHTGERPQPCSLCQQKGMITRERHELWRAGGALHTLRVAALYGPGDAAALLNVDKKLLSDIEHGRYDCPPGYAWGLIATMAARAVKDARDKEVPL